MDHGTVRHRFELTTIIALLCSLIGYRTHFWSVTVKQVLAPFLVLAAVGLVLSIIAHIAALTGLPQPLGNATWALHFGVFVVWLPAVVVVIWLVKDFQKKEYWSAALRGCPNGCDGCFMRFLLTPLSISLCSSGEELADALMRRSMTFSFEVSPVIGWCSTQPRRPYYIPLSLSPNETRCVYSKQGQRAELASYDEPACLAERKP